MFPTTIWTFICNTYKPLKQLNYPGPLSWCSNSTHDSALGEWQKCDTPAGTTLGQPAEGTPRFGMLGMEFLFVLGKNHPSKGKLRGPCAMNFPKQPKAPQEHLGSGVLPSYVWSPAPCRAPAAAATATHSLRDPGGAHDPSSRHPHRLQQKKPFSQSLQPFSQQCLDSRGYRRGKKNGGEKKKKYRGRERKNNVQSALH